MNNKELTELTEKFPSVLKHAIIDGKFDIRSFEPRLEIDDVPLFRGIRRKPGEAVLELYNSDFYSQAEIYYHIQRSNQAINESKNYDISADLKVQIELLKNTPMFKNYKDIPGNYSCSFSKDYEKMDAFIDKADKGRFVVKGFVKSSQAFLSEQDGGPSHVHAFLFEDANIQNSFEVTDGNT